MVNGHGYIPNIMLNATVMLIILIPLFIFVITRQVIKRKFSIFQLLGLLVFWGYLYALIGVTLFPIMIYNSGSKIYNNGFGHQYLMNINVFEMLSYAPVQIFENIVLILPLSILVAYLWPTKLSNMKANLVVGFLTTLSIETFQLIMNYFYVGNRTFDINDLILNFIGYLLGFVIYKISKSIIKLPADELRIY